MTASPSIPKSTQELKTTQKECNSRKGHLLPRASKTRKPRKHLKFSRMRSISAQHAGRTAVYSQPKTHAIPNEYSTLHSTTPRLRRRVRITSLATGTAKTPSDGWVYGRPFSLSMPPYYIPPGMIPGTVLKKIVSSSHPHILTYFQYSLPSWGRGVTYIILLVNHRGSARRKLGCTHVAILATIYMMHRATTLLCWYIYLVYA